jgi:hypothetical protein
VCITDNFIHTLGTLQVKPKEVLIGFKVILLFTRVQIRETLNLLSQNSDEYNMRLSYDVMTLSFFCVCSTNKLIRQFWWKTPLERDDFEDREENWSITLRYILGKCIVRVGDERDWISTMIDGGIFISGAESLLY